MTQSSNALIANPDLPKTSEISRRLLSAAEGARYLGISVSHFYGLVKAGALPRPVKLGFCARWDLSTLDRHVDQLMTASSESSESPRRRIAKGSVPQGSG